MVTTNIAFVNGRIYVSFKPIKIASGLLVSNGRVLLASSSEHISEVARLIGAKVCDLNGRVVIPGFVDAHVHVDALGLALRTLDLRNTRSIEEMKKMLKEYASSAKSRWILGHGWDHELFEEKRFPTRWDLDEAVPDRPVLITRICLHAGVVNTVALLETRVGEITMKGVVRDEHGEPTGVLLENALSYVREYVKEHLSVDEYATLIKIAQDHMLANGVTTAGIPGCSLKALQALLKLWSNGELKVRFRVYVHAHEGEELIYKILTKLGLKKGFGDDFLRILGVKLFADGALGARTAWLSEPYSDDPSNKGILLTPVEEIARIAKAVDEAGLQIAVHAIGDKAVEEVLGVYRDLKNLNKLRHRIEHASLVRDDVLEELSLLKPVVVVQPRFALSDWWAISRLGANRAQWLYRFRSMLERGVPLALSTDAPVEPINPWETVYAAVTRGVFDKMPAIIASAQESLTTLDALHLYTAGSAYALHSESDVGGLEPGMLADFIIVDRDPLATPPNELRGIKVLEVYVGGVRAWPR